MLQRSDMYYRDIVETTLRAAGMTEPPVSVEAVAATFYVPIRQHTMPVWFAAALIYEDGLPAILLNTARPAEVRRSALAHLLGHLLIALDGASPAFPRGADPDHSAADFVANELVTPAFMVRDQAGKWFNDYRYLAGLFGVTEQRMFEAMRDLGIIKSRGVIWDY